MKGVHLTFAAACFGSVSVGVYAQSNPPTPHSHVAIENTNAAFAPLPLQVPQASPARPTVTMPAHIPPTGYLQFEQGFNQANESPSGTNAQFALSQTTKVALTTRLMVQFITQPYTYNRTAAAGSADATSNDPGDLQLGLQGIIRKGVGVLTVVAVGYVRRVRGGNSADLDVGSYSQSALLLLSGDMRGGFHYDSNIAVTEQNSGAVRHAQFAQTLAVSHPLFEEATHGKLGGVVELSHFTQPLVTASISGVPATRANSVDLLFAAVYSIRPNLALDAAFEYYNLA